MTEPIEQQQPTSPPSGQESPPATEAVDESAPSGGAPVLGKPPRKQKGGWVFILLAFVVMVLIILTRQPEPIPWLTDPEQALSVAKATNKPLLIVFEVDWDRRSQWASGIYDHPRVVDAAEAFVPLRLNADDNELLLKRYHLNKKSELWPVYVIARPGALHKRFTFKGNLEPHDFIRYLEQGLEDVAPGT